MPSRASKETRKAKRGMQGAAVRSEAAGPPENCTVDGQQQSAAAARLEMKETVPQGHGKQSEQGQPASTAQQTAHRKDNEGYCPTTEILTHIRTRQPAGAAFNKSLPNTHVIIQQLKTKYVIGTKGLSEAQIHRACAKAFAEVYDEMGIVTNQQYSADTRAEFCTRVYNKADRIIESKRRRCARSNRQPKHNTTE